MLTNGKLSRVDAEGSKALVRVGLVQVPELELEEAARDVLERALEVEARLKGAPEHLAADGLAAVGQDAEGVAAAESGLR